MIVSDKLRKSAGHHDAHCMVNLPGICGDDTDAKTAGSNKQKDLHATRPRNLPRGREAKLCACGVWFVLPACHADRHKSCRDPIAFAQLSGRLL